MHPTRRLWPEYGDSIGRRRPLWSNGEAPLVINVAHASKCDSVNPVENVRRRVSLRHRKLDAYGWCDNLMSLFQFKG